MSWASASFFFTTLPEEAVTEPIQMSLPYNKSEFPSDKSDVIQPRLLYWNPGLIFISVYMYNLKIYSIRVLTCMCLTLCLPEGKNNRHKNLKFEFVAIYGNTLYFHIENCSVNVKWCRI